MKYLTCGLHVYKFRNLLEITNVRRDRKVFVYLLVLNN